MAEGTNPLSTPASVTTLYVRWYSDQYSWNKATWSGGLCSTPPPPTPTVAPTAPPTAPPTEPPTPTPTPTPPATPQQEVQLTLIKVLCPSYSVVPANKNPTGYDATGGHGSELDTSYQTVLVNPATDIPSSCTPAEDWQFQLYDSASMSSPVGSPLTTGGDGSVSVWLDPSEIALAQTSGYPTGLWVAEIEQPSVATFGALRCYNDIMNGDNLENIRNLGTADQHIYCIAYNVVVPGPTPTVEPTAPPTEAPTATPTVEPTAPPTEAPTAFESFQGETATPTQTPFESFQGETATPALTGTPPPTNTGSGGSNNSTPLFALLICLVFGGFGLLAVQAQRQSIRR
jgi:hypothetical protein